MSHVCTDRRELEHTFRPLASEHKSGGGAQRASYKADNRLMDDDMPKDYELAVISIISSVCLCDHSQATHKLMGYLRIPCDRCDIIIVAAALVVKL